MHLLSVHNPTDRTLTPAEKAHLESIVPFPELRSDHYIKVSEVDETYYSPVPEVITGTTEILEENTRYYTWLFREKKSKNAEPLMAKLAERRVPEKLAKKLEGDIKVTEVRRVIHGMSKGKTPGPDLLTAEFYQTFSDILEQPLTDVLNEAHKRRRLPSSLKQGILNP